VGCCIVHASAAQYILAQLVCQSQFCAGCIEIATHTPALSIQQLPALVLPKRLLWLLVPCRRPQYVAYASIVVSVLHVLSFLFTHWIVSFNALVNYKRVDKLNDAEYIQVGLAGS
jgi:hypothetical protein